MNSERFAELVAEAVQSLPDEFRDLLYNVDVVATEEPTEKQKQHLPKNSLLLGLYEGIPQTKRGTLYNLALPDKITVFQKPIETICHNDDEIKTQIGKTVRHEIAHHFGISDERLKELERERQQYS